MKKISAMNWWVIHQIGEVGEAVVAIKAKGEEARNSRAISTVVEQMGRHLVVVTHQQQGVEVVLWVAKCFLHLIGITRVEEKMMAQTGRSDLVG